MYICTSVFHLKPVQDVQFYTGFVDPIQYSTEATEQDELKDNQEEKIENENEAKQGEATEQDELKDNQEEKTENKIKAKQQEVTEQDELKDNEEDTEKIRISKRSITITAKPPMLRGETRAKYMCQLARQLKQRSKNQPTKDEWEDCST